MTDDLQKEYTINMKKASGKNKGKKLHAPTKDQYTVVLEDLRSQFKAFGESLAMTRDVLTERIQRVEERIQKIDVRLQSLEMRMQNIEERMQNIEVHIQKTEERLFYLERTNLELLKEIRENTISRSEFEELRAKVRHLESKFSK